MDSTAHCQVGIICQEAVEIPSRIFVGNLPYDITDIELQMFFSKYGKVKDARVCRDRKELPRGFGFVTFVAEEEAQSVLELGTVVYQEKKRLNISKAIRRQGKGQYCKPNKEYTNAKRVQILDSPSGEYILNSNNGKLQPFNCVQPSKPCLQYVSPAVLIQPGQPYQPYQPMVSPVKVSMQPPLAGPLVARPPSLGPCHIAEPVPVPYYYGQYAYGGAVPYHQNLY